MIKIAICDDSLLHCQDMGNRVQEYMPQHTTKPFTIENFTSVPELEKAIANRDFSIALLDIDYGKCHDNGIALAKKINQALPHCQIIFITAHISYVSQVYEADHTYFVLKNAMDKFLSPALGRALENLEQHHNQVLCVKNKQEIACVPLRKIIFIERKGRVTTIHTSGEEYTTSDKIEDIYERLPELSFGQCHKSFLINFYNVENLKQNIFICKNKATVPISRSYYSEVKRKFAQFVANTL